MATIDTTLNQRLGELIDQQTELLERFDGGLTQIENAKNVSLAAIENKKNETIEDLEALTSSLAPLASPAFTGTPTAPTPAAGDNSTKIATTEFVHTVAVKKDSNTGAAYIPAGTTEQRPSTPVDGAMRYNTELSSIEIYNYNSWNTVLYRRTLGSNIGIPGEAGFGVGIAPESLVKYFNLTPMCGYDDPSHPNYGNYTDASGSVMVFIPKHYVKLSYDPAAPYYGLRVDVSDTPQDGYSLPRCFVNNGVEVAGIFVDKYLGGREGGVMVSKRNLDPVSTHSYHNPISNLTANGQSPQNRYDGMYAAVKTRGANYSLTTIFTYTMLANLADAHYQACYRKNDFSACAWADVEPYQPKGNNNDALKDTNDANVVYTGSGYSNCGLTGGVADSVFAKITHNGQKCGVVDLNGNMWEVAAGYITDSSGTHLMLKESVDVKNLTPTEAYNTSNYDAIIMPLTLDNTLVAFGNDTNQLFSGDTDRNSNAYKLDNLGLPLNDNAVSSSGTNRFGKDGFSRYQLDEMCVIVGGYWKDFSITGVRTRNLSNVRSSSDGSVGGRACLVPSIAG